MDLPAPAGDPRAGPPAATRPPPPGRDDPGRLDPAAPTQPEAELGGADPGALGMAVAAVARRLGVAPATLRTWDRRYGLGPQTRTSGSHRRYGVTDLARLDLMRRLVNSGVAPADAARAALAADLADLPPVDLDLAPLPGAPVLPSAYPSRAGDPAWDRPVPWPGPGNPGSPQPAAGAAGEPALPGLAPSARGLGQAALALDGPACIDVIHDAIGRHGVVWAWEQVLVPVLAGIGRRWQDTGEGIEVEHLASESIMAAMTGVALRLRVPANARPVLLACTDEETHSLPLFAVAAALSERRVAARVLGARVPHDALVAAIRRAGPAAVMVWSRVGPADRAVLGGVCAVRPTPLVVTAGPGWTGAPPPGVLHVHDLADAVRRIASTVR